MPRRSGRCRGMPRDIAACQGGDFRHRKKVADRDDDMGTIARLAFRYQINRSKVTLRTSSTGSLRLLYYFQYHNTQHVIRPMQTQYQQQQSPTPFGAYPQPPPNGTPYNGAGGSSMAMMGDYGTGPKIDPFMGTSSSNPIGSSDTKGGQTSMDSKRQSTVPPNNNNNNYDNNNGIASTTSGPFLPPPTSNPPTGPPAAPPVYIKDVSMLDTSQYNSDAHLLAACRAKGISPYFATQITRLREYSSVRLVLDDSGSMKAMQQVYGQGPTIRWKILQEMVKEIFDLMTIARGREPLDVYFLNMLPQGMKADTVEALYPFFQRTPQGTTPTLEVMREIMTPEYMVVSPRILHPVPHSLSSTTRPDPDHPYLSFICITARRRRPHPAHHRRSPQLRAPSLPHLPPGRSTSFPRILPDRRVMYGRPGYDRRVRIFPGQRRPSLGRHVRIRGRTPRDPEDPGKKVWVHVCRLDGQVPPREPGDRVGQLGREEVDQAATSDDTEVWE
jgi:hypothetical protein